jgi:hypothetical protein
MAAAIAGHHAEPVAGEMTLLNLIKVSWRLVDTLGYAAFSPDKEWPYEELLAFIPRANSSWLGESAETACARLNSRLAVASLK